MSKKTKKDKKQAETALPIVPPTKAGVTTNAAYYIEKLEQIAAAMEGSDKVPEPWTKPIRDGLDKLKLMFNNAIRFL